MIRTEFSVGTPQARAWFCEHTQQAYTRQTKAQEFVSRYQEWSSNQLARWDADLARRSGAVMLLSGAVLLATFFAVFLRSKSFRLSTVRPGRFALALGVSSSLGFFVSSVVLRLSYQPYAEILQHFIRDGDETGLSNLRDFLVHANAPIGSGWLTPNQDYPSYFWSAVIVLCALALLVAVLRYFLTCGWRITKFCGNRCFA